MPYVKDLRYAYHAGGTLVLTVVHAFAPCTIKFEQ